MADTARERGVLSYICGEGGIFRYTSACNLDSCNLSSEPLPLQAIEGSYFWAWSNLRCRIRVHTHKVYQPCNTSRVQSLCFFRPARTSCCLAKQQANRLGSVSFGNTCDSCVNLAVLLNTVNSSLILLPVGDFSTKLRLIWWHRHQAGGEEGSNRAARYTKI